MPPPPAPPPPPRAPGPPVDCGRASEPAAEAPAPGPREEAVLGRKEPAKLPATGPPAAGLKTCCWFSGSAKPLPSCRVTIRMPGLRGAGGGETRASAAAGAGAGAWVGPLVGTVVPAPTTAPGVEGAMGGGVSWVGVRTGGVPPARASPDSALLRVEVDALRLLSGFLMGPRCVSLNSTQGSGMVSQCDSDM